MKNNDGRKNNGVNRNAGRKKGIGIANDIKKHCEAFINTLLLDDAIKLKATKQISFNITETKDYLYIIKNESKYKIGFTSDIKKRYNNYKSHLGSVNLIYVYESFESNKLELFLHEKYKKQRVIGEYFNLSDKDLLDIISYCSKLNFN